MTLAAEVNDHKDLGFLHEIGARIAAADPIHTVLKHVVEFVTAVVNCDSCFVYVMEGAHLILRASKNSHEGVVDRLKLRMGQGITGWVAEHKKPVALAACASLDPRFQFFDELPEDRYEAILAVPVLCRGKLVGVINVQHRESHPYSQRDIQLISTIGFLIGPEIEMARVEGAHSRVLELSEARKLVDSAIQILQRDMRTNHEQAQSALRAYSRQSGKSMKEVAEAILLSDEIKRSCESAIPQSH
jgi:signal transduction protein with GAF and PtsI domain